MGGGRGECLALVLLGLGGRGGGGGGGRIYGLYVCGQYCFFFFFLLSLFCSDAVAASTQ